MANDDMEELENARYGLSFDVAKSMRYHAYRRKFFDNLDKLTKILVIGTGGATFISLIAEPASPIAKWFALVVAVLTAIDIIIGFSQIARLHDKLYRDFGALARTIARTTQVDERQIAEWSERRLEIETEEPGVLDWLERCCSREEAEARGDAVNDAWKLPPWKRRLSNVIPS